MSGDGTPRDEGVVAPRLTHVGSDGSASMVDVGAKPITDRRAVATSAVHLASATLDLIESGSAPKGPVLATAELAGIQGAKRTSDLIPLCHPLELSAIVVRCTVDRATSSVLVSAEVQCSGKTGVEMEALTAASVAALTIYDMVKAVDRGASIGPTRLIAKSGGARGEWRYEEVAR